MFRGANWWLGAESNRRHEDFQSSALPTELPSRKVSSKQHTKVLQDRIQPDFTAKSKIPSEFGRNGAFHKAKSKTIGIDSSFDVVRFSEVRKSCSDCDVFRGYVFRLFVTCC